MGRAKKFKKIRKITSQKLTEKYAEQKSIWLRNLIGVIIIFFSAIAIMLTPEKLNTKETAKIITNRGEIKVELYRSGAPKTVENFVGLVKSGYYNNLIFHRVIENFMIQAGDPFCSDNKPETLCGTGGESFYSHPFEDEINQRKVITGVLAMANSGPDTNGSQFFIVTGPDQPQLDGKHTVFGKVIEGMDIADTISKVETDDGNKPIQDVKIEKIEIVE